ncbi:hypothetical protein D3C78_1238580 [compost metagenome]
MHALGAAEHAAVVLLGVGQTADGVFDDHHGAVDNDAEVQCAKAHQVGTDLVSEHAGEGEEHGQWNHHGGDQCRADVAQEQEQHGDHQDRALDEVFLHRGDGLVHQRSTVVDGDRDHALGQRAVDLLQLVGHGL